MVFNLHNLHQGSRRQQEVVEVEKVASAPRTSSSAWDRSIHSHLCFCNLLCKNICKDDYNLLCNFLCKSFCNPLCNCLCKCLCNPHLANNVFILAPMLRWSLVSQRRTTQSTPPLFSANWTPRTPVVQDLENKWYSKYPATWLLFCLNSKISAVHIKWSRDNQRIWQDVKPPVHSLPSNCCRAELLWSALTVQKYIEQQT